VVRLCSLQTRTCCSSSAPSLTAQARQQPPHDHHGRQEPQRQAGPADGGRRRRRRRAQPRPRQGDPQEGKEHAGSRFHQVLGRGCGTGLDGFDGFGGARASRWTGAWPGCRSCSTRWPAAPRSSP
uniref:Uncharacterized protein n=1 Tax=Aegilops tauschii subsp. strangulata TaxID=200361 RepID=A0A452Z8S3_AEGTS